MTTVYLVRHAEAEGNVYRRCHGQYDSLLTERGWQQLSALANRFEQVPIDAIYASDLYRARHTAKAIADRKGQKVKVRSQLREIDMGQWEDKTWALLPREFPEVFAQWQTRIWECQPPDGETIVQAGDRVLKDILALAQNHSSIVVVSHGSAIRAILCRTLGYTPQQMAEVGWGDNTCVAKFEVDHQVIKPIYWNDASHLPQELSTFAKIGWTNHKGIPLSVQAWYRPYCAHSQQDKDLLVAFGRELYQSAYGSCVHLKEQEWIEQTNEMAKFCARAVTFAMVDEKPVGLVRLAVCDTAQENTGMIGGLVLDTQYRGSGLSGQMLGQAISVYRALGKEYLCATPSQTNLYAQSFYRKHGFVSCGQIEKAEGLHICMKKRIQVDTLQQEYRDFIVDFG